jgi:hypothetical protein
MKLQTRACGQANYFFEESLGFSCLGFSKIWYPMICFTQRHSEAAARRLKNT